MFQYIVPGLAKLGTKVKKTLSSNKAQPKTDYQNPYYNPYKDVYGIYKAGNEWQSTEDENRRKEIQNNAKKYYDSLRNAGYAETADKLENSGSDARLGMVKQFGKIGKSPIRDRFYALGEQYGLSRDDIDKNLSYDNDTGEVTFYGQKLSKPFSVVDGRAYYDNDTLEKTFSDAMNKTGKINTFAAYNKDLTDSSDFYRRSGNFVLDEYQNNKKADEKNAKYSRKLLDEYRSELNKNPFTSSEARAIYNIYGAKGDIAAGDATASSAAQNSGNVDSFAEANARRQQLAFTNAANEAILNNVYQKLNALSGQMDNVRSDDRYYSQNRWNGMSAAADSARASADGLRINAQNRFTNNETKRLNDIDIAAKQQEIESKRREEDRLDSETAGFLTGNLKYSDNPYFKNGKLINPDLPYSEIYTSAKENGDNKTAKWAAEAASYKTTNVDGYEQYAQKVYELLGRDVPGAKQTETGREFDKTDATNNAQIRAGVEVSRAQAAATQAAAEADAQAKMYSSDADYASTKYKTDKEYELGMYKTDADNNTDIKVAEMKNSGNGSSSKNTSSKTSSGESMSSKVNSIIKNFNSWTDSTYGEDEYKITSNGAYGYTVPQAVQEKFVKDIADDSSLSTEQKAYIFDLFNIPSGVIDIVNTDAHYRR